MSALSPRPRLPGRVSAAEHQAAVARRLDLLRAELAAPPPARRPSSSGPDREWGGPDESVLEDVSPEPGSVGPAPAPAAADEWWAEATRVRPVSSSGDVDAGLVVGETRPAVVPVPGRHAARRRRAPVGDAVGEVVGGLVPETLRGRVALGAPQLAVVAVLVAVGLAVTTWWVVRASPEPVPAVAAGAGAASPQDDGAALAVVDPVSGSGTVEEASGAGAVSAGVAAPAAAADAAAGVTVDVAGKVRRPGIAVLGPGARVVDAIEAAGGARTGVDLTSLNLARLLVDGEQVLVGVQPAPGSAAAAVGVAPGEVATGGADATAAGAPAALVDLNAASESQLDTLPEVGPVTAQSIIAWRAEHGGFSAVDELLEVDGIGEATLARIAPHVTV